VKLGRVVRGAVVALLVGWLAWSAWAVAAPRRAASGPTQVHILSVSQRAVLRAGTLRVLVRTPAARVVWVSVPGSPRRRLRFRRAGTRVVALALGAARRRELARCVGQRLVVRAAWGRLSVAVAGRNVRIDLPACARRGGGATNPGQTSPGTGSGNVPGSGGAGTGAGTGGNGAGGGGNGGGGTTEPPLQGPPTTVDGAGDRTCDYLDPAVCLQPWPNDWFTTTDSQTPTGRRLNIDSMATPANREGKHVDPTDHNRADGFSPGNLLVTRVPGLDTPEAFRRTGAVPITDMARYADPDQPVVVIDAATEARHPVWSEIDANPADAANRNLIVRPSVNWQEGHRYIVALRNLRRADGSIIEAQHAFRVFRDRLATEQPNVEDRRPHMERLFASLAAAGIARKDLYLAWDFTVASRQSLTDRMLSIRNDAFAQLGDTNLADLQVQGASPTFTVDSVTDFTPAQDSQIARRVQGKVTVPCYLNLPGCPAGSTFLLDAQGRPQRLPGNTLDASYVCNIPRSVMDGGPAARPSLYGHGLLGSRTETNSGPQRAMAAEHRFMYCGTDWIGMACTELPPTNTGDPPSFATAFAAWVAAGRPPNCDLPTIATILHDASNFPMLADRVQQGMLDFLYVGRAMIHSNGFKTNAAFQRTDGSSVIDTTRLYYDGNSQGGIIGGALAAVAVDHDRAALGVPGMNYSTLLRRSVDFDSYAHGVFQGSPDTPLGLYDHYPNELERPLLLSLMQLLWDRAEADGYAQHMTTDPLPNTPAHEVLLHLAFGDHQVANVAAETEARTIGASVREPYLDPGRSPYSTDTPWGLPPIGSFPFAGSAIVMWDSGSPTPPTTNTPPRAGADPHSHPRSTPAARAMKSAFLRVGGVVTDTCGLGPCYANGYHPPPSP
jgi:hypothetical protein